MGQKRMPGLIKRGELWHIDKRIAGKRIREGCGTSNLLEAQKYLARRMEQLRDASVYGVRPPRLFKEAAIKFLETNGQLRSIDRYARALQKIMPYIGNLTLDQIHMGALQKFINDEVKRGCKKRTINYPLQAVRRIVNLAHKEWIDENGLSWLAYASKIKLLEEDDKRKPYPLSWEEQDKLFNALPEHLRAMAQFKVNTGCRETEVCSLQWDWEIEVPMIAGGSVFLIPEEIVKNGDERLVVINKAAKEAVESQRGKHHKYVFTFRGNPLSSMLNDGWKYACEEVGLPFLWVHDLKHTFGYRLRSAGVSFEDRQDLLGHRSKRITTHYSSAELSKLHEAANKVCHKNALSVPITLLKRKKDEGNRRPRKSVTDRYSTRKSGRHPHKMPTMDKI